MLARRADRVLLRVAPAVPRSLDGAIDEFEPVHEICSQLFGSVGCRREGEHLPDAVIADDGDEGLAAGPARVPVGAGKVRVGGHEPLLDGEHEVMRGMESRGWDRWITPPEPQLKRADRVTQL
jgi:hypothetical protein